MYSMSNAANTKQDREHDARKDATIVQVHHVNPANYVIACGRNSMRTKNASPKVEDVTCERCRAKIGA